MLRFVQPDLPLLSLLLATPCVGVAALAFFPARWAARVSATAVAMSLLLCAALVFSFAPGADGFQFVDRAAWIPTLGIGYVVGVDALSIFFLPLTVLLFAGALISVRGSDLFRPRLFHGLVLLQLAISLAILCALDTLFFFAVWEAALVPFYFLVTVWCEHAQLPRPRQTVMQYLLLMLASGVFLLFGLLLAAQGNEGVGLALDLTQTRVLPRDAQTAVFVLLLAGLAAKLPIVPLHTWLPRLALDSPAGLVASFAALKLAAYAFLRLTPALTPDAARDAHWLLAGLGGLTLLYGAVSALAQSNLRRALAFSAISHLGLVLVGISAFNPLGRQGAVLLLLSFPLTSGGLFLLTSFLHRRVGSTDFFALGGIVHSAPRLAALFLFFALASIGLPGLIAFPAELMILVAALQTHTGAGLAALFGAVVGAAALVVAYRRVFLGPPRVSVPDLRPDEFALALLFAMLTLVCGIYPSLLLNVL